MLQIQLQKLCCEPKLTMEKQIEKAFQYLSMAEKTDYIGESVSQLEHALQCAYFAEQAGHSKSVILASLFHDIGHFASSTQQFNMEGLGVAHHEWIGAKLAYDLGFSAKVALLIGYHVEAKRYLAAKKPNYYQRLSEASKGTLNFQGGLMSQNESLYFETHPYFKEILQVRVNDEKAKEVGLTIPGLEYYRSLLQEHFNENSADRVNTNLLLDNYVDTSWAQKLRQSLEEMSKQQVL